jgi:hypothetical protein
MRELFPYINIHEEKFFGMTKSLIALNESEER